MTITYEINHSDLTQYAPAANWINVTMPSLTGDASRAFRREMHALGFDYDSESGTTIYGTMRKHNNEDVHGTLAQIRALAARFGVDYTEEQATYTTWTDVSVTSVRSGMTLPAYTFKTREAAEQWVSDHGFDNADHTVTFAERVERDEF